MTRTRTLYSALAVLAMSVSLVACGTPTDALQITPVAAQKSSALDDALDDTDTTSQGGSNGSALDDALDGKPEEKPDEGGIRLADGITVVNGDATGSDAPTIAMLEEIVNYLPRAGIKVPDITFAFLNNSSDTTVPGTNGLPCEVRNGDGQAFGVCVSRPHTVWLDRNRLARLHALEHGYTLSDAVAVVITTGERGLRVNDSANERGCIAATYGGVIARGDSVVLASTPDGAADSLRTLLAHATDSTLRNDYIDGWQSGFQASLMSLPSPCAG